jgi:O-antigen ligase
MRRAVTAVAAVCLLTAPTVLAFFSGGYLTEPRLVAAIVTWSLVVALALAGPMPLPHGLAGRLALAGLTLIAVWSAISLAWAPLAGPAIQNVQRLVVYVGALLLGIGALRTPRALRAVEPALAAGATVVIGYGLAGRLLPGILELARSQSAGGRLEQPITYWNSEGALAAVGLILCARLAGDGTRPVLVRALAAAAAAPLGAGVYLSFSRGATAVAVLGLVMLVAAAPTHGQLRAAATALATGALSAACTAPFPGVAALEGARDERIAEGLVALVALVLIAVAAGLLTARRARAQQRGAVADGTLPWPRRPAPIAIAIAAAMAIGLVIGGLSEKPSAADLAAGAKATRLTSVSSNRYEYWRIGLQAFGERPLTGLGSGGFRVFWLRERSIPEAVKDVHSLELEMLVELGLVGLLAFALLVAGVAVAAHRALRRAPGLAAGPCAAVLAWLLHASIDWDWELPAVTLPAIVLAAALVVAAEAAPRELSAAAR